jgi:tRNA (guanosine-2'-O-)-methyltransferase
MKTHSDLSRQQRIKHLKESRRSDLALVLENLDDDKNIAMILRTAESFGVGKIYIIHTGKKPKMLRKISSGAAKWLDIKYFTNTEECLKELKAAKFKLYGALVNPEAAVLWEEKFTGKVAIVMGSESKGLSEEAQKLVDKNLYLPMFGLTESLNVAIASSIFLYEVIKQKEIND